MILDVSCLPAWHMSMRCQDMFKFDHSPGWRDEWHYRSCRTARSVQQRYFWQWWLWFKERNDCQDLKGLQLGGYGPILAWTSPLVGLLFWGIIIIFDINWKQITAIHPKLVLILSIYCKCYNFTIASCQVAACYVSHVSFHHCISTGCHTIMKPYFPIICNYAWYKMEISMINNTFKP